MVDFSLMEFSQGYQSNVEELWISPSGIMEVLE
jgi:hypothetical protein